MSIIATYCILYIIVFAIPGLEQVFSSCGYSKVKNFKQLEKIEIEDKKEMKQYHIDVSNRMHMEKETQFMKCYDYFNFYFGLVIVFIFLHIYSKKAKICWDMRQKKLPKHTVTLKWNALKHKDIDHKVTKEFCELCDDHF